MFDLTEPSTEAPPSLTQAAYPNSDPYDPGTDGDDGYQISVDGGAFGPAFDNGAGTFPSDLLDADSNGRGTVGFRHSFSLDTEYTVSVRAVNNANDFGSASNALTILKPSSPLAASFIVDSSDSSTAVLEVTPVASATVPSGFTYSYEWSVDLSTWTAITDTSNTTVTGLTGFPAVFVRTVASKSGVSTAPGDEVLATDATPQSTVPGAPTGATATAGDASATVSWTAPADNGGAAITSYTVTANPGGATCTTADGTTTTCNVTGLTNGTAYTFTVIATNSVGNSTASAASTAITPAGVPGAPTGATATASDASATVSWTAPTNNGGAAIASYTVTANPGGATCTTADGTTTTCNVTGLTNGTAYTFTVIATNSAGNSAASTASAAVTPAASSTGTDSGSNTDSGTDSETATDSTSDDTADDTTGDDPIAAPETATTSEAVTEDDASELASEPGDGKVIVDGTPVTPTVSRVADDAVDTPPAERTPEQVTAIQEAAQELVDGFNDIAGEDSPVAVTNTETGAVITGLLTNPDDPDTPVEVPVERVLVMTAGDLAIMAVATDDAGDALPLDDGSLQMSSNGNVAMAVAGLPASTAGEIVLLPSRTVLGTFTTSADGVLTGEITIPADLAAGDYGIAIAVGTSRMSLGVKAAASPAELPATGGGTDLAAVAVAMLAVGLLLAGQRRRGLSRS